MNRPASFGSIEHASLHPEMYPYDTSPVEGEPIEDFSDAFGALLKTAFEHDSFKQKIREQNMKDFGNPYGRVCISKAMHDRLEQSFKNGELK